MLAKNKKEFIECFYELDDHRADEKVLFPLHEILFLVINSVMSCAESWDEIAVYGEYRLKLLRKYFPFEHGIPSKSTICAVIGMINKRVFEKWFTKWSNNLVNILPEELIAIDGKTIRGSRTQTKEATHVLNAFATKHGLVLAQRTVNSKTNEITEIPKLLDDIEISGGVVSLDAMGCQKKIAKKIIEKNADYFLSVKRNQPELYADIQYIFDNVTNETVFYEEVDKGHGRVEVRRCYSIPTSSYFLQRHQSWGSINSLSMVTSERHIKGKIEKSIRYYISSAISCPIKHLSYSRHHWMVENNLHWVLDVTFKEDLCMVKNAAENMSVIRKLIMNLIKRYREKTGVKNSLKSIRRTTSYSEEAAEGVLNCLFS